MGSPSPVQSEHAAPRRRTGIAAVLILLSITAALSVLCAVAAVPARAAAAKGIMDWRLDMPQGVADSAIQPIVDGIGPAGLNATWTRVYVRWARLQPYAPGTPYAGDTASADGYDDAYVKELDTIIAAFHAQGVRVILTGTDCPKWASDSRYRADHASDSIVPRIGDPAVLTAWKALAAFLAVRYTPLGAGHFEVWNEPNLASGLYPQLVGAKKTPVGPAVYLKMLNAFDAAAHKAAPAAVVIAGATSRRGANDASSTSPQWFATYLKDHKAQFDAYSHHPYTPPGSSPVPSAAPRAATHAVTLGNLDVLLKIFPKKPFYLTEYGLSTNSKDLFCVSVSEAAQAKYLKQAYALVSTKRQVKAMLWFLVQDFVQDPQTGAGVYCGLIDKDGVRRKPAWYAFAGKPVPPQ